ncbi:MAG: DUF2520 domain-containing protein [Chitinophagaceae bacterium]|nr:MAG: DUF2520 domain-containing protein [Chitinophagaceae bacterium]
MEIVIIGTGNTATVLGKSLRQAGHSLVQVLGRDAIAAKDLAQVFNAPASGDLTTPLKEADLVMIAVSDSAIAVVANALRFPAKAIVVHTAASVSRDVLKEKARNYGVFYPLQSLKKEVAALPEIPIMIDANNNETLGKLEALAKTITPQVHKANDSERLQLHLAAVMVNNFTNHLYTLVEDYCKKEGLEFSLLLPLVQETASRLNGISPALVQTGPAIRNDTATIQKHLALLENHSQLKEMYRLFTESIQKRR